MGSSAWAACREVDQDALVDAHGRSAQEIVEVAAARLQNALPDPPLLLLAAGLARGFSEQRPARIWVGSLNGVCSEQTQKQCEADVIGQITRIRRRSVLQEGGRDASSSGGAGLAAAKSQYVQSALR